MQLTVITVYIFGLFDRAAAATKPESELDLSYGQRRQLHLKFHAHEGHWHESRCSKLVDRLFSFDWIIAKMSPCLARSLARSDEKFLIELIFDVSAKVSLATHTAAAQHFSPTFMQIIFKFKHRFEHALKIYFRERVWVGGKFPSSHIKSELENRKFFRESERRRRKLFLWKNGSSMNEDEWKSVCRDASLFMLRASLGKSDLINLPAFIHKFHSRS